MPNHRNACSICFLILIVITCDGTSSNEASINREGPMNKDGSINIEPVLSGSKSEEEQKKPIERERSSSESDEENSDSDRSEAEVDSGPKMTRGILRDQSANGEASDERRKKRHAFFYRGALRS
ncbi:uncharacterized protein LOC134799633 isoform X2 [Cydia splendana]|uniref:uncharacterized protein LOC134799633 isoform X2 n=1 Tax=Cydia splendana TaxID=1100963 RepID=UPI00300D4505